MRYRLVVLVALALGLLTSAHMVEAQSTWHVTSTIPLGGSGTWDYLTVDPATHRLFIPRSTHTMILDAVSGKVLGDVPGQKIAHGVALARDMNRGFISDGGGGIVVFDLKTYKVLGTIPSEKDSDGIIYDARTRRVLVVSGDGGDLMVFPANIDPVHGHIAITIPLEGAPEFLAADASGKVYINLEDKDVVAVVDLASQKVVARWPVAPGGAPVGMALDEKHHRLIIGCRKPQQMVVMNTLDGTVIASMPIGSYVDATKVAGDEMFASCGGDGTLTVVKETAPGRFQVVQTLHTALGARTMGIDSVSHTIYLPTGDYAPNAVPGIGKVQPLPGTFKIIVAGKTK